MEAAAAGEAARTRRPGDGLVQVRRADFQGIVAVEAVALAKVLREEHEAHMALATAGGSVPSLGKLPNVDPQLP